MNGLTLTQWATQFIEYVKQQTGVEPLIYTGAYFAQSYLESSITSYDLWIAAWPSNPNPQTDNPAYLWQWSTWAFWQYAGDVAIPGVTTQKVDLDVFNGTLAQMQANYVIPPKSTIAKSGEFAHPERSGRPERDEQQLCDMEQRGGDVELHAHGRCNVVE